MIEVTYVINGIKSTKKFRNEGEIIIWFERQKVLFPDVKIVKKTEC